MKKSTFILGIVSIMTLCLTACGKPNMSFEDAVDSIGHSQLQEMMNSAEYSQQNFNISTKLNIPEEDVKGNITFSANSKQNAKDSQWETTFSLDFNVNADWDKVKIKWDATMKKLADIVYLSLNSLDISKSDVDFIDEDEINKIKWQRYSLDLNDEDVKEMLYDMYDDMYYDMDILEAIDLLEIFDLPSDSNVQNLFNKEKFNKFINDLKKSVKNEWALIYSGMYSQFSWYNAYKFSIDRGIALNALLDYFEWIFSDEDMEDILANLEEYESLDEMFEDFPFTNFEGYIVITWKNKVQVIIENIDVDNYYYEWKLNATFGKDLYKYQLIWTSRWSEDDENIITISAILSGSNYNINIIFEDEEVLTWTITPSISNWKISVDFDLLMKEENYRYIVETPLQWWWSREKISEFNVEAPEDSKDLMEESEKDDYYDDYYNNDYYNPQNEMSGYNNAIINYNDSIVNLATKCVEAENNIRTIYEDENAEIEDVKASINDTIKECKNSLQELNILWDWEWDSSLKDWTATFLEKEIEYYQKFYELLPYLYKQELTENEKTTYDTLSEQLGKIDEDLSKASEDLETLQTQFSEKHNFDLEGQENSIKLE